MPESLIAPAVTVPAWHGLRLGGIVFSLPCPALPIPPRPGFPGHHLRGVLGRVLFETVCPFAGRIDDRACPTCPLRARCAYPRVFKPVEPERLAPAWVHGWTRQGRYRVCTVLLLEPAWPCLDAWLTGLWRYLERHAPETLPVRDLVSGQPLPPGPDARPQALQPTPAPATMWARALTPLVSKHQGDGLLGALRTRAQRLILSYGDGSPLALEATPWVTGEAHWRPETIRVPGRVVRGQCFDLRLTAPTPAGAALLGWGQWLHGGGHVSLGCGCCG